MTSTGKTFDFIRHTFKVSSELKSYTVYEFIEVQRGKNLLTDLLRIEQFQGKSNASNINNYLRIRNCSNWSKCEQITGLRPTIKEGLFYGDWRKLNELNVIKKTLLIFKFSKDRQTLFIDVYGGFYPLNPVLLQNIITTY